MDGGKILGGLLLLLAFLVCVTMGGMGRGFLMLLVGGVSLLVLVAGLVMLWMGWKDRAAQAADPGPES